MSLIRFAFRVSLNVSRNGGSNSRNVVDDFWTWSSCAGGDDLQFVVG